MPAPSKPKRVAEVACAPKPWRRRARPVLAIFLLGQWVLLLAFSSSEKLHHSVCDRAKQPTHDCAFATIAKSQLTSLVDVVQVPLPKLLPATTSSPRENVFRPTADFRLTPNRGPPSEILPI